MNIPVAALLTALLALGCQAEADAPAAPDAAAAGDAATGDAASDTGAEAGADAAPDPDAGADAAPPACEAPPRGRTRACLQLRRDGLALEGACDTDACVNSHLEACDCAATFTGVVESVAAGAWVEDGCAVDPAAEGTALGLVVALADGRRLHVALQAPVVDLGRELGRDLGGTVPAGPVTLTYDRRFLPEPAQGGIRVTLDDDGPRLLLNAGPWPEEPIAFLGVEVRPDSVVCEEPEDGETCTYRHHALRVDGPHGHEWVHPGQAASVGGALVAHGTTFTVGSGGGCDVGRHAYLAILPD